MATSWLTQRVQFRSQQLAHDVSRREQLYEDFIEEASKLYADAYEHDEAEISKFVKLYELVNALRYRENLDKVPPLRISELADALQEIDDRLAALERRRDE